MESSVGSQEAGPSDRILAPSRRLTRGRTVASCSARSSVSVAKRRRRQIVLAIVACLLTSTVAQHEGSSVAPYQTPQGAREVSSASVVSRHSTEARRTVTRGLQNPSTVLQRDLLALGRNLYTRNLVVGPVDPTVPVHVTGTSWDPSGTSGLLSSSSPADKNSSEVLDHETSSLAKTDTSLVASSKGPRESTDVSQLVEKGKPGLSPTASPTSPLLPDVGRASHLNGTPAFQMALASPSTAATPHMASGIGLPTAATNLTSAKPPASEGGPRGEEDLPGTPRPLTQISHTTHLGQTSTGQSGGDLPSAETAFLTHWTAREASVNPKMLGRSPSLPTLPMGRVPSEPTHVAMDVLHSTSGVTAHGSSESILRVSTGMHSGSLPTRSSSRSVTSLQEAALNGHGPRGSEPATRDSLGSTTAPTAPLRSSAWPLSSSSHSHATLPDFVTRAASSETEGLVTHSLPRYGLVPASVGSPKLDDATTLSTSTSEATAERGTEVPLSITSRVETSEARSGVGDVMVPSVRDSATVSALARRETLGPLSTPGSVPGSEATSGFPVSNTRLPASRAPRTDPVSSSGAAGQMETGPTTHSPRSSPDVSPSVHFSLPTVRLELETVAADNATAAVPSASWRSTPGEGSTHLGPTLPASPGATEEQEGVSTARVLPSPSPGDGIGREWKEGVLPTAEPSTEVPGRTSIFDGQRVPTSPDVSSGSLPTESSSLLTFNMVHSRGVTTEFTVPSPHTWASLSTLEALPSADVTDSGSHREETRPELHDGTWPITAAAGKVPASISEQLLAASSTDSLSGLTSATPGVPPALSTERTESTPSLPPSPTFLMTSGMAASEGSFEPETLAASSATDGASGASVPTSATMSNASTLMSNGTLPSRLLDATGAVQPARTTAGGTRHVGMVMGSPSTSPGRELFHRTPSERGLPLLTPSQAAANRTEVMDTSRAMGTSTGFFVRSTGYRSSSQTSASPSHVETKSIVLPQPNATQAVSQSSTATDRPASSRMLPTTQGVSPPSAATDPLAHSRILPATQALSPSSSTTDALDSSRIPLTTQAVSPSSSTTYAPDSSRILPTTQAVSSSSSATDAPASSRTLLTTQAVSLSSSGTDMPASSRTLLATQAVPPSSSTTDALDSSRTLLTTQAVSPSSSATDAPDSSRILPTTQAVSPSSSATDVPASSRTLLATQAVFPSSSATDVPASFGTLHATQAVSLSSSATDAPDSSRTVLTTQAVSPSSPTTDMLGSSRILPTTQVVSPPSSATAAPASSRTLLATQAVSSSSATDAPGSSRTLLATQAVSPSSSATDTPDSSRTLLATQAVSPSFSATVVPDSSRNLPTTQAVSPSSSATDAPDSSRTLLATQAVSPSSSATGTPDSSRTLPATQAVSPSFSATVVPDSSRILPTTQAVSPSSSATDAPDSSRTLLTTQAVSPSSSSTDVPDSSKILPTTQTVSLSSSNTDAPASSRTLLATQAVSLSSSATDMPASFRIRPTTHAVSPSSTITGLPASSRIFPTTLSVSPSFNATDVPDSSKIRPATQTVTPPSSATNAPASSRTLLGTQAVSVSSSATDVPASFRILPASQAVFPSSSTTDAPASSRILPATQAVSPSSTATDLPASSRILPSTQAVSSTSSTTDMPASPGILPTTQAVAPSSSSIDALANSRTLHTIQALSPSSTTTGVPVSSRTLPSTQAVSLSSSATDPPASSRILPATHAPSSTATDLSTSSRILPTTQAVSPSHTAIDLLASSGIIPATQALSSTATDLQASSRTLPATQAMPPSSSMTDPPASLRILSATHTPSSNATDPSASSRVLPTTQAMSPSSTATDPPASSRILPATHAASPSSTAIDPPASSRIFPTTQAVSPSSTATDPPASSRILPATHAPSPSSTATDPPASSRVLPATQAVSPSSTATDPPASSRTFPATQAVSPSSTTTDLPASSRIFSTASVLTTGAACSDAHCLNNTHMTSFAPFPRTSAQLPITSQTLFSKVVVSTLGPTVGMKGTTAGSSTKVETPKVTSTTALTGMKPGTMTRDGSTSEHLASTPRASTVGQTAERDNITLSRRTLAVSILSLEFHLTRIEYTESLANKSSTSYKKLEREVILTLNKMLSFYETFLRANILRFLNGSVVAQTEAVFRGDGLIPTPSDMIRMIVTAVQQRETDAFFDWRVDLRSLHCNGFTLKNLDPEVLAISFTLLGHGSVATFGGLTDWGPLESLRYEVVQSLGIRYRVQNFSLVQVRNVQGDLDISGEICVNTVARVDIGWALEALKGLANYSVDLGSLCINGSRLSLQIFPISFLVTNKLFSEKLLDRSSTAHQSLSWDLSKALMHTLGQYRNLLQVTIREVRGGSLICYADVIFQPPAPTSKDLVRALALSVGPKNYLGASGIQVDPFSFTVAGATVEPPFANPGIPGYGVALIVLIGLAVIIIPVLVLLYKHLGWKEKMVIHRFRDPEVMVETFELDNPTFRSLTEENNAQSSSPTEALG